MGEEKASAREASPPPSFVPHKRPDHAKERASKRSLFPNPLARTLRPYREIPNPCRQNDRLLRQLSGQPHLGQIGFSLQSSVSHRTIDAVLASPAADLDKTSYHQQRDRTLARHLRNQDLRTVQRASLRDGPTGG
ncbi:hypothetical protein D3C87_1062930 [compost metagenome]